MEGENALRMTVVEKREVVELKTRHRASGLILDYNVKVNEASTAIEQGLHAGRLYIRRGHCGYRPWRRNPRADGKNQRRTKHQAEPLQCGHWSTSASDRRLCYPLNRVSGGDKATGYLFTASHFHSNKP
jgi:hypothetical protein